MTAQCSWLAEINIEIQIFIVHWTRTIFSYRAVIARLLENCLPVDNERLTPVVIAQSYLVCHGFLPASVPLAVAGRSKLVILVYSLDNCNATYSAGIAMSMSYFQRGKAWNSTLAWPACSNKRRHLVTKLLDFSN